MSRQLLKKIYLNFIIIAGVVSLLLLCFFYYLNIYGLLGFWLGAFSYMLNFSIRSILIQKQKLTNKKSVVLSNTIVNICLTLLVGLIFLAALFLNVYFNKLDASIIEKVSYPFNIFTYFIGILVLPISIIFIKKN